MTKRKKVKKTALEKEFDAMYKQMQTPEAQAAFDALLDATPEQLTRAARKSVAERDKK